MAANPETLTVEDLIAQAIQQGKLVEGINDPDSLKLLSATYNKRYPSDYKRYLTGLTVLEELKAEWEKSYAPFLQKAPEVELITKALRIGGSPEKLAEWLQTPVPPSTARRPTPSCKPKKAASRLRMSWVRIEHGVY